MAYMTRLITRHRLFVVLTVALVLRIGILIALYPSLFAFERTGAIHGSGAYDLYALNLLASGVYGKDAPGVPDAHLPPLISYVVAGIYATLGRSGFAVGVVNIVFDLISITTLYHLCKRLLPGANPWLAPLVGLMVACYPYLIFQNLTLIDTPLFMALFYSWLLTLVLLRQRSSLDKATVGIALASGVLLGLMALVRTNMVLLAPTLAIWFLFRRSLRQTVARLAIVALVSALTISPWIVRNYAVYGQFVPVAMNGGENLYQGNNPQTVPVFRAGYDVQWIAPPADLPPAQGMTLERNAALAEAAWSYLGSNPQAIPELIWTKLLVHWSIPITPARNPVAGELPRFDYQGNAISSTDEDGNLEIGGLPPGDPVDVYSSSLFDIVGRTVHLVYFGALFLLSLLGMWLTRAEWRDVSLIWIVQIATTIIYVMFHPSTRYRVPTDPLLFIFAASALIALVLWQRSGARQPLPAQKTA